MQSLDQLNSGSSRRGTILLILFSSIGILGFLVRGIYLSVPGIPPLISSVNISDLPGNLIEAVSMFFCATLLLPMLVYNLRHLHGRETSPGGFRSPKFWQALVFTATWLVIVVICGLLSSLQGNIWIIITPLLLLGICIPIFGLVRIAAGGLPVLSRRRTWSLFGYGLVGSTVAAFLLEYLVIGFAVFVLILLSAANPELKAIIEQVKTQITNADGLDIQTLLTNLGPSISNPLVLTSILLFAAILAPLIEETVKPLIIWFLGKTFQSPAEGFALGALCGAGFALLEGLLTASGAIELLGFGIAGRAAASLMHITASGLVGWGIASAQLEKRYGRLILTYLIAVSLHGLWNGSAILAVFGALQIYTHQNQIDLPSMLFMLAGLGALLLEFALIVIGLPIMNRYLRHPSAPAHSRPQSDIIAPPATSNLRETNGLDS